MADPDYEDLAMFQLSVYDRDGNNVRGDDLLLRKLKEIHGEDGRPDIPPALIKVAKHEHQRRPGEC